MTAAAGTTGVASAAVPLVVAKWVVISVVGTTVGAGAVVGWKLHENAVQDHHATGSSPKASAPFTPPPRPPAPRTTPLPPRVPETTDLLPPVAPVLPVAHDVPVVVSAPIALASRPLEGQPPSVGARPSPPMATDSTARQPATTSSPLALGDELKYLDEAREALARSDPWAALQALDVYHERVANPRFDEESTVLRIDALVASGRWQSAERLSERFLAVHPESTYAQHIRSVLRSAAAGSANP